MQYFVETWSLPASRVFKVFLCFSSWTKKARSIRKASRFNGPNYDLSQGTCERERKKARQYDWWAFIPSDTHLRCNFSSYFPTVKKRAQRAFDMLPVCWWWWCEWVLLKSGKHIFIRLNFRQTSIFSSSCPPPIDALMSLARLSLGT